MKRLGHLIQHNPAWIGWSLGALGIALSLGIHPAVAGAQWAPSGNDIYNTNTGFVGVGTPAPASRLHVYSNTPDYIATVRIGTNQYYFGESNLALTAISGDGNHRWAGIGFNAYLSAMAYITPNLTRFSTTNAAWAITADGLNSTYASQSFLSVRYIDPNGVDSTRFLINYLGNVGIGTTTPAAKLHVAGDVLADGNLAAKYQDVAEWVLTRQPLSAGTVVVVDTAHANQVVPSSQAYDTMVAGVISDHPGLILGEGGEGKVKVAAAGRVKVKVDASGGPIQAGDLLVTSPKAGMAMRSEPVEVAGVPMHRPGTLLGKALESLHAGEGEILVLLTLQ